MLEGIIWEISLMTIRVNYLAYLSYAMKKRHGLINDGDNVLTIYEIHLTLVKFPGRYRSKISCSDLR